MKQSNTDARMVAQRMSFSHYEKASQLGMLLWCEVCNTSHTHDRILTYTCFNNAIRSFYAHTPRMEKADGGKTTRMRVKVRKDHGYRWELTVSIPTIRLCKVGMVDFGFFTPFYALLDEMANQFESLSKVRTPASTVASHNTWKRINQVTVSFYFHPFDGVTAKKLFAQICKQFANDQRTKIPLCEKSE